ncbi:MAG: glycosyltransferase, partial [Candidatus Dojkabacteria bacterium]
MKHSIQVVGNYVGEYSLSKVNRGLALALSEITDSKVSLWAPQDMLGYKPGASEFKHSPQLKKMIASKQGCPDVQIYDNFPKGGSDQHGLERLQGKLKVGYLAWEESVLPELWVSQYNKYLHAMFVTSKHVGYTFRNSGLQIPVINISEGLSLPNAEPSKYKLRTKKSFKFLHISSAHARKGVDVLIKAYFESFSDKDDVVLVLKLFPNPNADVEGLIKKLDHPSSPEIEIINDSSLSDGEMISLHLQSDAGVYPSRAEGFGLPIAEAMYYEKPVITTAYSGQMDFVTEENSFLIDYEIVPATDSHLGIPGSRWAEPDVIQLGKTMKKVFEDRNSDLILGKVRLAKKSADLLTWDATAKKMLVQLKGLEKASRVRDKHISVITTYNTRCGIAEYSRKLYTKQLATFKGFQIIANSDIDALVSKEEEFVSRAWSYGETNWDRTLEELEQNRPDLVHIQYSPEFYTPGSLLHLVEKLRKCSFKIAVTLHSVQSEHSDLIKTLSSVDLVFVHSKKDLEALKTDIGGVVMLEHGIEDLREESKQRLRRKLGVSNGLVLASHGLIHDRRGLLQTIEAVADLRRQFKDILFLGVNALNPDNPSSEKTFSEMQALIKKLKLEDNVLLIEDFLAQPEIIKLLQLADILIMAYDDLSEGASGAVRTGMSARRPVIITD